MDDLKSYTVRVESGEIRLMSKQEVSKLVQATMARAENGTSTSKNSSKFTRHKGTYSAASDLSRRLSLSPRPFNSARKLQIDRNQEESSKSPTSKLFHNFRAAVSTGTTKMESNDDKNVPCLNTAGQTKELSLQKNNNEEQYVSLVRAVAPLAIDRNNNPQDVSFTVSTEIDGQKNLSEKELNTLVRSSIIRARYNAKRKKPRRMVESSIDTFPSSTRDNNDASFEKSISQKFSWSTVEKSDNEGYDDMRDDETAERTKHHHTTEGLLETRDDEENIKGTIQNSANIFTGHVADITTHSSRHISKEFMSSPCSSPNDILNGRQYSSPQRGYETPILSLVMSAGGESVLSDKDICKRVEHSMAKARLTRQEITELLEDTPSDISKMDVANLFNGTMRRDVAFSRSQTSKSLSPRRRRPMNFPATTEAPSYSSTIIENHVVNVEHTLEGNPAVEIVTEWPTDITTSSAHMHEELPNNTLEEVTYPKLQELQVQELDSINPSPAPASASPMLVTTNAFEEKFTAPDLDKPVVMTVNTCSEEVIENADVNKISDVEDGAASNLNTVQGERDQSGDIVGTPDMNSLPPMSNQQNTSCCFQMCCMPIILSPSLIDQDESELLKANIEGNAIVLEEMSNPIQKSEFLLSSQDETNTLSQPPLATLRDDSPNVSFTDATQVPLEVNNNQDVKHSGLEVEETIHSHDMPNIISQPSEEIKHDSASSVIDVDGIVPYNVEEIMIPLVPGTDITNEKTQCVICFDVAMNTDEFDVPSETNNKPIIESPLKHQIATSTVQEVESTTEVVLLDTQQEISDVAFDSRDIDPSNTRHDTANIVSDKSEIIQTDSHKASSNSQHEHLDKISDEKSQSILQRKLKHRKYKQFKEFYEVKTVITDDFLSQVISRKGSKISVSELAKILQGGTAYTSDNETKLVKDYRSISNNSSVDESFLSNERSNVDEKIDSSLELNGFCADFMLLFSDLDHNLHENKEEYGNTPFLCRDESRETMWVESIVDATSKDVMEEDACRSNNVGDEPTRKGTEYESEFAGSLDEQERRRLTFSFSDGRYTVSLSSSDEY